MAALRALVRIHPDSMRREAGRCRAANGELVDGRALRDAVEIALGLEGQTIRMGSDDDAFLEIETPPDRALRARIIALVGLHIAAGVTPPAAVYTDEHSPRAETWSDAVEELMGRDDVAFAWVTLDPRHERAETLRGHMAPSIQPVARTLAELERAAPTLESQLSPMRHLGLDTDAMEQRIREGVGDAEHRLRAALDEDLKRRPSSVAHSAAGTKATTRCSTTGHDAPPEAGVRRTLYGALHRPAGNIDQ